MSPADRAPHAHLCCDFSPTETSTPYDEIRLVAVTSRVEPIRSRLTRKRDRSRLTADVLVEASSLATSAAVGTCCLSGSEIRAETETVNPNSASACPRMTEESVGRTQSERDRQNSLTMQEEERGERREVCARSI